MANNHQGQSGYSAGRHAEDRALQQTSQNHPRHDDNHPGGQQGLPGVGQQTMYGYGQQGPGQGRYADVPSHRGKGPLGYTRSDDRIREAVCEALTEDHHVDATHIEVVVKNGEVILTGSVADRRQKRAAEDCAEAISGVHDVQNQLRIQDRERIRGNQSPGGAVSHNETVMDKKPRA
jgi:osmotically-inducible protein OsmY